MHCGPPDRGKRGTPVLREVIYLVLSLFLLPALSDGQEIDPQGWPVPDLRGLLPYFISVSMVDGVEKVVERFHTPGGEHVARISGNGRVFAYAVDSDREPPMDYLLLDAEGAGIFIQKFRSQESYSIPEWVSR